MEIFIAGAVLALVFGAVAAVTGGVAGVANSYGNRRKEWAAKRPDAHPAMNWLSSVGDMLAMLRYGPPAFIRGAKKAWPEGWARGKERAARFDPDGPTPRAKGKLPQPGSSKPPIPAAPGPPPPAPGHSPPPMPANGKKPAPPNGNGQPTTQPPPKGGTTQEDGPLEIKNIDDLVTACQMAVKDAQSEVDNAIEALNRAWKRRDRYRKAVEDCSKPGPMKLPANQLAILQQLVETQTQKVDACKRLKAAADTAKASADKALKDVAMMQKSLVGVAAGSGFQSG